jgi:hypothetical protein
MATIVKTESKLNLYLRKILELFKKLESYHPRTTLDNALRNFLFAKEKLDALESAPTESLISKTRGFLLMTLDEMRDFERTNKKIGDRKALKIGSDIIGYTELMIKQLNKLEEKIYS